MDKTLGRVQMLEGHIYYSPNCARTVVLPLHHDKRFGEQNILLPNYRPNERSNFFEIDIAFYRNPRWWTVAFGWLSFLPLAPYLSGPIFEKLGLPRDEMFIFDEESRTYAMPEPSMSQWLRLEQDMLDAVVLIRSHYNIGFIYPHRPSIFRFDKKHPRSAGLHMAMRKGRNWFVVWMALLSFVIALSETIYSNKRDSVFLAKRGWYDILQEHFDCQWLEALAASTVYSFSSHTERAGVFLDLMLKEEVQPEVDWFCKYNVPVWYRWDHQLAKNPKYSHLAPLPYQLQESTTTIARSPLPSALPERPTRNHDTWLQFLTNRQARYDERIKTETDHQKQVRLSRLQNPPKRSAKVFEWVHNSDGDLVRESVSAKMREQTLSFYPTFQIYYDPIENEYDCCEEYNSGAVNDNMDDNDIDDDDISWDDEDVHLNIDYSPPSTRRIPSPDLDFDDTWSLDYSRVGPNPSSVENFISEILRILRQFFGYTPLIPTPSRQEPYLRDEKDMKRFTRFLGMKWIKLPLAAFQTDIVSAAADFVQRLHSNGMISDDEWDLGSENRESLWHSTRIKTIRVLRDGELFMFDFQHSSTVEWKVTTTTAAHALLVCRLDECWKETDIVFFLLENGIPFHTLQPSHSLPRSPLSTLPPLVVPFRPANYSFTWRDYAAFRQQCHDVLRQPRGRAALMRGHYPWRLAIYDLGFSSVLSGPSGWSTDPQEMLVVKIPETSEEFIDDKLTDMELKCLSGLYHTLTGNFILLFIRLYYINFIIY